MKEIIELQLYPEIKTWIEEVSYFFGEEVQNNNSDYYKYEYLDDCLLLMEDMYNCNHVHSGIMAVLQEACEIELFKRGIYGKPLKIKNNLIIFEK